MNNDNEVLECWERIDNTLCLNNDKGNLEFGIDDEEHIDCDNVIDMIEDLETIKQALLELKSIKEANTSEALVCFENMQYRIAANISTIEYTTIKQALLKTQEPKQYLKWEDLEFDNNAQVKKYLKVKLGDNVYSAFYHFSFLTNCELFCIVKDNYSMYISDKQFFNDLHLEVVEE